MNHRCIKPNCANDYEDSDEDAYYCFPCREQNKILAENLNNKLKNYQPSISDLQRFDILRQQKGLVKAKDLGL